MKITDMKKYKKQNNKTQLPKTALPIIGAIEHWIDIDGSVYAIDRRNNQKPRLMKKAQSEVHGYKYCGIKYKNGKVITKRVHRLVAEAFIPNPNGYRIVGHKNNIKSDNRVENLYWTTTKENTQKAFDDSVNLRSPSPDVDGVSDFLYTSNYLKSDGQRKIERSFPSTDEGLVENDKGRDDSQSKPVIMYDTYTNREIGRYGSCKEAQRETGLSLTTICRQAKYHRPTRKPYYFRYEDDEDTCSDVIGMFDFDSDKLVRTFLNSGNAARETGISERTICQQVEKDKKTGRKYGNAYFLKLRNRNISE